LTQLPVVHLINDLEANAHGIAVLAQTDFVTLNEGAARPTGNRGLISAGTGLGEAGLLAEGGEYRSFPSEGGHVDFAPRSGPGDRTPAISAPALRPRELRACPLRPGPVQHLPILADTERYPEPAWLAEQIAAGDGSAVVSRSGLEGTSEICTQALDIFCSIYGSEAGNLALKLVATGGMFIGGGIAPRIIKKLTGPAFMKAFVSKGRISTLLESIPVRVITNDKAALLGAGRVAALSVSPAGKQ
jgi:glucokinase